MQLSFVSKTNLSMQTSLLTLVMLVSGQVLAQQTNTHFSHTLTTEVSPEAIWRIWTDVPNWNTWDDGLKTAELNGPFTAGATGRLIPDKGPKAKFRVTEVVPGRSYTFRTALPLGALYVKRFLSNANGQTAFTHEVWFTGLTKGIFGRTLGRRYRQMLPEVMTTIKRIVEQRPGAL